MEWYKINDSGAKYRDGECWKNFIENGQSINFFIIFMSGRTAIIFSEAEFYAV
ncbi:hypothetical protein [Chryseobacterium sp. NFX27]|uniref:hypothetical protein n=1 Tax=Chryseobacterium sp. NFX27 TaxID=2819618 RepID=UPI003CF09533